MTGTLNQVVRDVEPHLPVEFMTARQIWESLGMWSLNSVCAALRILVDDGKAVRISEPTQQPGTCRYLYRRAQVDQCERVREAA